MKTKYTGAEIAIIGMAGKFPGAEDLHAYWNNLSKGVESIQPLTDDEILAEGEDPKLLQNPRYVKASSYLRDKEYFDANFFGFLPEEAEIMDPQVRMFLQICWSAIEDAGYDLHENQEKIGLFAGATPNLPWMSHVLQMAEEKQIDNFNLFKLSKINFLCTRVSNLLNLQGPSIFMDTACSTSLVAVQRACMSLLLRECNMALAGGVSINNYNKKGYLSQDGGIYSEDGHCRAFDAASTGTVGGEGTGVVLLKKLDNALKDGDHIYAIIKGSGINNDGSDKMSFTAPSVEGQYKVILKALKMANVPPESISYVETHGTGTKLGDPIEIEALNLAFGGGEAGTCAIGSVKSNIGHTDMSAGVASLIKAVLALQNRQLPPSLHYETPNPKINFGKGPFFVNTELQDWTNDQYPLRAGVSSFGMGGTNAHLVLEEAPTRAESSSSRSQQVLLVSGKTRAALQGNLDQLSRYLENNPQAKLADIAYTLQEGRSHFAFRKALVGSDHKVVLSALAELPNLDKTPKTATSLQPEVVFMFSGQGSQYAGMCADLYEEEPVFRTEVDQCLNLIRLLSGKNLKPLIFATPGSPEADKLTQTEYTQPALFVIEYALAKLMMKWGFQPDMLIGHSIGEYAAACISGVFSLEDALALVIKRGELMQQADPGKMLSIAIEEAELLPFLTADTSVSLAAVNSSTSCVVAGEEASIIAFQALMEQKGYPSKILHTSHAFHSHMMDPILPAFEQALQQVSFHAPQIPIVSNLSGTVASAQELMRPDYWLKQLRNPVRFAVSIAHLLQKERTVLIETGPGKVLYSLANAHAEMDKNHSVVNLVRHPKDTQHDLAYLLGAIGKLWTTGLEADWNAFYEGETRHRLSLPTYAFEKTKYQVLVNPKRIKPVATSQQTLTKQENLADWYYSPTWQLLPKRFATTPETEAQSTLVLVAENEMETALVERFQNDGEEVTFVRMGRTFSQAGEDQYQVNPAAKEDFEILFQQLAEANRIPTRIVHAGGVGTSPEIKAEDASFFSLIYLLQAAQRKGGLLGKKLIVLSTDLHPVLPGQTQINPTQALALGAIKVIPQEFPSLSAKHIDLSSTEERNTSFYEGLYQEILHDTEGKVLSLRNQQRWEQVVRPTPARPEAENTAFQTGGVYLITGGLGAVGMTLAEQLLRQYKANVILLGRTALGPKAVWPVLMKHKGTDEKIRVSIEKIQSLREIADQVEYYSCNIAEQADLAAVVAQAEEKFGAIQGVIHAAGVIKEQAALALPELARKDFDAQFEAKVQGLQSLKSVFETKELDFCLLTSSLSSLLGGLGFTAYAAANAYMDAFVQAHQATLPNWISVNFDGLNFDEAVSEVIDGEELVEAVVNSLEFNSQPQIAVSATDLPARWKKWVTQLEVPETVATDEDAMPELDGMQVLWEGLSPEEASLLSMWRNFFRNPDLDIDDNFFEIGGDSLRALAIVGRIHKEMNVEVGIQPFFNHPTVRQLAKYIAEQRGETEPSQTFHGIPAAEPREYYPLSSAQKRLYFLYEFSRNSLAYNLTSVISLAGMLDKVRFETALKGLIASQEMFRTAFTVVDGEVVQKIEESVEFEIEHIQAQEADIDTVIQQFARPFQLDQAPLMRVGLIETAPDKNYLILDLHHLISDGVSKSVFVDHFTDLYQGKALSHARIQYKDYAVWQQSEEQLAELAQQKNFWLNEFANPTTALQLPIDFPRPQIQSFEGDALSMMLDQAETQALKDLADREGATLFMVLLGLFNVFLSKLSRQSDIIVGTPVANRQHADLEEVIGMFVNTLALRNYPEGHLSFQEFLAALKPKTLDCFDHQSYPYEELVDELNLTRDTSRNALFDVSLVLHNVNAVDFAIEGLQLENVAMKNQVAKFDLSLEAIENEGQLKLWFEYASSLFRPETIERFMAYFHRIVKAVVANPSVRLADIELLDPTERVQLLETFNDTERDYAADKTLVALFEAQVQAQPESVAVRWEDQQLSYAQLNEKANQIAAYLRENSAIQPGALVGVMLEREAELLPSIYGILKAGAAYVPIDPHFPPQRIQAIVEEANLDALLTRAQFVEEIEPLPTQVIDLTEAAEAIAQASVQNPPLQAHPHDLAYVIFTSGSTGKPKGVMIEHHSVINRLAWMQNAYPIGAEDVILQKTPIVFDVSVWELFWWGITGASVALLGPGEEKDPHQIVKRIEQYGVTTLHFVPSMLGAFLSILDQDFAYAALQSLKQVFASGEALKPEHVNVFGETVHAHAQTRLINLYGPTEATVDVSYYECSFDEPCTLVPIGKPIDNIRLHILSDAGQLNPIGIVGELCIAGVGLARGYLGREALTAEKFMDHPQVPGERIYRTGDLARWLPDGNIAFLGRIDHQVKIRGNRIELGEIEHQLLQHEAIQDSAVLVQDAEQNPFLVAYYVGTAALPADQLREYLSERLPIYMVPTYFVHLEAFPLTPNGKLDRRALPKAEQETASVFVAPETEAEKLLAEIWSEVLGVETIGITDNFFGLGGDSIKSIQISARVRKAGYELSVQDLFSAQTIRKLALRLKSLSQTIDQQPVTGTVKLTSIQQEFFKGPIEQKHHYNQAVMLNFPNGISAEAVLLLFGQLQQQHDALRMVFVDQGSGMQAQNQGLDFPLSLTEWEAVAPEEMVKHANQLQAGIDLENGPLMRLGLFQQEDGSRLLIVIHHLLVDGVSWRILLGDLETLYQQHTAREPLALPPKTTSYQDWSSYQEDYRQSPAFQQAQRYWNELAQTNDTPGFVADFPTGTNQYKETETQQFRLSEAMTQRLLREANGAYHTQINDLLLAALYQAVQQQYGQEDLWVAMEGHGRETMGSSLNVSRTVGWFTSIYPVRLAGPETELAQLIKMIKEQLRQVPNKGWDYLLNKHGAEGTSLQAPVLFNYLGQFDTDLQGKSFQLAPEQVGNTISPEDTRAYEWEFSGIVQEGQLEISCKYSQSRYQAETMAALLSRYEACLTELISYCYQTEQGQLTPSDLGYKALSIEQVDHLQTQYPIEDLYPLSPMQEGMLFHTLVNQTGDHYFEQFGLEINGTFDLAAAEDAMQDLVNRYPVLRTNFLQAGYARPLQFVRKEQQADFQLFDIRNQCYNGTTPKVRDAYYQRDRDRKFDLEQDALVRLTVLWIGEQRYEMIWSFHHILMDGWCVQLLFQDFQALYQQRVSGQSLNLPAVVPYAHYIEWLGKRDQTVSAEYWQQYLAGYETLTSLPGLPTPAEAQQPFARASHQWELSAERFTQLKTLSERYGVTINTIVQTAWGLLLSQYNRVNDVVFGTVVSGRPAEIEGIETMVGLFINTLPVRIQMNESQTLAELLQATQQDALAGEAHHYHPLSEIQANSALGRGLLDHILVFENYPVGEQLVEMASKDAAPYKIGEVRVFEQTNYDLTVMVVPGETLAVNFHYNAAAYAPEQMAQAATYLDRIFSQFLKDASQGLSQLSLVDAAAEAQIFKVFNDTAQPYTSESSLMDLFEAQVAKYPDNLAVRFGSETLTYAQLNEQADRIASWLRTEQDVQTGELIGVMMEREHWLIPTIYGILKAGAAYVPISPDNPLERKQTLITDAGLKALFTRSAFTAPELATLTAVVDLDEFADSLAQYPVSETPTKIAPNDLAYVIYTSGSTGKPKGVMIEHHSVINRIEWMQHAYPISSEEVILQKTPIIFDVSVWELFWWGFEGASLSLLAPGGEKDPQEIVRTIERDQVSTLHFVPSMLNGFLSIFDEDFDFASLKSLRQVFASGEALKIEQVQQFGRYLNARNGTRLINLYGPTEATVDVSYYECSFAATETRIPIGKPIQNTRLYILSAGGQLCPIGVPGELAIGGTGLARGYLGNEALTAERFVESPVREGERIYLTGDLACWLPDGNIEFLGRIDHQVKIRGYRIELGEIESQLARISGIDETVVLAKGTQGDAQLVAYYTGTEKSRSDLKNSLGERLPDYMVPTFFVHLEEIPLTPSGKISRRSLPEPTFETQEQLVAPETELEGQLVEVWSEVLGLAPTQIGLHTNFFDLGGHSIKLLEAQNLLNQSLDLNLSVASLFRLPTIAALADFILHGDEAVVALEESFDEREEALSLIDND